MKNPTTFEDFKSELKLKRKLIFSSFGGFLELSPSDAAESYDRPSSSTEPENRTERLKFF